MALALVVVNLILLSVLALLFSLDALLVHLMALFELLADFSGIGAATSGDPRVSKDISDA